MSRTEELDERLVDWIVAAQAIEQTMTEITARLAGMTVNNVLFSGTVQLDSSGVWTRDWRVPFASVAVGNFGEATLTVATDGRQASAPTFGEGVQLVGPGDGAVVNMAGRVLTLYGNPGDRVSLQLFDKPQGPAPSGSSDTAGSAQPTTTRVAGAAADELGLSANPARAGVAIFNEQAAGVTTVLYVLLGTSAASATNYTIALQPGSYYEAPANYRGQIRLFFSAATGAAQVTELV